MIFGLYVCIVYSNDGCLRPGSLGWVQIMSSRHVKLRTHPARNSQLLGQIDICRHSMYLFDRPTSLPVARTCTTWTNMCTVRLESEISGTWNPGRHKQKSFISNCTKFSSFPVRSQCRGCLIIVTVHIYLHSPTID